MLYRRDRCVDHITTDVVLSSEPFTNLFRNSRDGLRFLLGHELAGAWSGCTT